MTGIAGELLCFTTDRGYVPSFWVCVWTLSVLSSRGPSTSTSTMFEISVNAAARCALRLGNTWVLNACNRRPACNPLHPKRRWGAINIRSARFHRISYTRFSPTSSVGSPRNISFFSFSRRDFELSSSGSSCTSAKQAWAGGKLGAASSRQETVELKVLRPFDFSLLRSSY